MRQIPPRHFLIWQVYLLAWIGGVFCAVYPLPALTVPALLILADRGLWRPATLCATALIFSLAMIFTSSALDNARSQRAMRPQWGERTRFCASVQKVQGLAEGRLRVFLNNTRPQDTPDEALPGLCVWTWDNPTQTPLAGQTVCLTRPIRQWGGFANGGQLAAEASSLSQKIYWRVWSRAQGGEPQFSGDADISARARNYLLTRFIAVLKDSDAPSAPLTQPQAILVALLFGDRQFLSQRTVDAFGSAALAHSLALSGQHLCVASLLGFLLIRIAGRFFPRIYLLSPRLILCVLAALPFAALYLWLGNAPASLLRAFCMLAIFTFWICRRQTFSGTDLLCAALLLILLFQPLALFDFGLQLSALCVAVIALAVPAVRPLIKKSARRAWQENILWIFCISLLIQLALLPLNIQRFHTAGFWFGLNVIWLPLLGLLELPIGAAGLSLAAIPAEACAAAAEWLLSLAVLPGQLILYILEFAAGRGWLSEPVFMSPHWGALAAFAAIAIGLSRLSVKNMNLTASKFLVAGLALLALGPLARLTSFFDRDVSVEALDVGQGQAILIKFPPAGRVLLDAGGSSSSRYNLAKNCLLPILTANHAPLLDAVINSHPDLDHMGSLPWLCGNLACGPVFHNGRNAAGSHQEKWRTTLTEHDSHALGVQDVIRLGNSGLQLEVMHPPPDNTYWRGNSASLILRLSQNGQGLALFPGDADKEALRHLLWAGGDLTARVVIAPHHGSDSGASEDFYEIVRPDLVIACCGLDNRWHYPGHKLDAILASREIPLLDTGNYGKITVNLNSGLVESQRKALGRGVISGSEDKRR